MNNLLDSYGNSTKICPRFISIGLIIKHNKKKVSRAYFSILAYYHSWALYKNLQVLALFKERYIVNQKAIFDKNSTDGLLKPTANNVIKECEKKTFFNSILIVRIKKHKLDFQAIEIAV
jgi:hypothetical protein